MALRATSLVLALLLVGCAPFTKPGARHYLVLGFGVVSVNSTNQALADVSRARVLGVLAQIGPGAKITAGYSDTATITIKTNSNIIIDVSKEKVEIPCLNH